jgi:hypothetical protein
MGNKLFLAILWVLIAFAGVPEVKAGDYMIGAYYFPGWHSQSDYWRDLQGLPGSRSPGRPWPELEPLQGFGHPEESVEIMEKKVGWASAYAIDFFAFDWYWDGSKPFLNHAIEAYQKAQNRSKLKYCLLWANAYEVPTNLEQFTAMIDYWLANYFKDPQYLRIDGKPVVIIFSPEQLLGNAGTFRKSSRELFTLARAKAEKAGLPGIYFIGHTPANSHWVKAYLPQEGYDALTAYNHHSKGFSGEFTGKEPPSTNYAELLEGYKSQWNWILQNSSLPYVVPMSSGWDRRPWGSNTPHDNSRSTPESFRQMLLAGREVMDRYPDKTRRMGIIYAWNEFGEGGYIEPTKKWGFQYLQAVKDVFGP